ncbi:MAG: GNAT family N-acetyltransferase [Sedimentisphaerales bacterium]|nr:GNAT family N-acetyltransferase [Sedimentisphaerales bacterium]
MLKFHTSISKDELIDFVTNSSNEFKPPLHLRVKIDDYCEKLIEKSVMFVAREDEEVVGIIAFYCNDDIQHQAYLTYFFVKKDKRRKGIGKILLDKSMSYSKKCGMKSMKLATLAENQATSIYRRNGFRQEGTRNTHGFHRVIMIAEFEGMSE